MHFTSCCLMVVMLQHSIISVFALLFCRNACALKPVTVSNEKEVEYIVYMGGTGGVEPGVLIASHHEVLTTILGSEEKAVHSITYSYKHGFNGFSAILTKQHADIISELPNVVSVFPSKTIQLHTTRSWDFLGVVEQKNQQKKQLNVSSAAANDVILGILDTGLWPEAESFRDTGFGPVPARWKGVCNNTGVTNSSELFRCNKKIIGGRAYPLSGSASKTATSPFAFGKKAQAEEFDNARDSNGHGTHTSSTAAGQYVESASMLGLAPGTARGGFSKARIAMYKVCWFGGSCSSAGILAGFDDAIHDGVDVLSLSLGGGPEEYDLDGIAIGAYHAIERGIIVACSAGNSGPSPGSVSNGAPWILTVGASTIDRKLSASILLGNKVTLLGTGLNLKDAQQPSYKVVAAGDIPSNTSSSSDASHCVFESLEPAKVRGNIIVCLYDSDLGLDLNILTDNGAAGLILVSDFYAELLFTFDLRATIVKAAVGDQILSYIKATKNPTASILKTETLLNISPAPAVASFSSRGPNTISPDIVKPDITAPGVNILAAWSGVSPVLSEPDGNTTKSIFAKYNIISGTSMSCPHAAGALLLLKSVHPDWSPAAIKSSLMTTASALDNTKGPITDYNGTVAGPFEYGSGEINPTKAVDPGLVYDLAPLDYIAYLCASGYSTKQVSKITGDSSTTCPSTKNSTGSPPYLNYPSIGFVNVTGTQSQSTQRTVTNVGPPKSVYTAQIVAPPAVGVAVTPSTLSFTSTGQKLSYTITVTPKGVPGKRWFGSVTWTDGSHVVRSPIAIH